jgi:hypothetical protein
VTLWELHDGGVTVSAHAHFIANHVTLTPSVMRRRDTGAIRYSPYAFAFTPGGQRYDSGSNLGYRKP